VSAFVEWASAALVGTVTGSLLADWVRRRFARHDYYASCRKCGAPAEKVLETYVRSDPRGARERLRVQCHHCGAVWFARCRT
jgi:RNase P subunit RPR2